MIADVEMSIISDEREEFVMKLVHQLDSQINEITAKNKRSSKLDAAILTALDYSCERVKAEKRVRNLEAQIALYDANLRRMREENIKLRKALLEGGAAADIPESEIEAEAENAPSSQEKEAEAPAKNIESAPEQLSITEDAPKEDAAKEDKLREIADLFHRADNTEKSSKIGEIESLLRGKKD